MRFLFAVDQLPFPPRNGVTIPTFNYLSRLNLKHDVYLLYAKARGEVVDLDQLVENRRFVKDVWIVERYRKPKLMRIKDELMLVNPYFMGWKYDEVSLKRALGEKAFDVVWVSPFGVADIIGPLKQLLQPKPVFVGGMNDCFTAMMREFVRKVFAAGFDPKTRVLFIVRWLRSWAIGRMEAKVLREFDMVLVQTEAERKWLSRISRDRLLRKIHVLSNGVNEVLFNIPIECDNQNVLFLGDLKGVYSKFVTWFIRQAWPLIESSVANCRFFIVGSNASSDLLTRIKGCHSITHIEYMNDICDIFKGKAVTVGPVFKNYGLINKIVESMAAGVPVVGDSGSFNGIPGFVNGRHGICADNGPSMAQAVIHLLTVPQTCLDIAHLARVLVKTHFMWSDRISDIEEKLTFLRQDSRTT